MLRSFALYALLRSRRSQTPTSSVLPTSQTMLTATQATSRIPSQDIVQQQQLSVQHSPLTCFTATLLGAAFSLHFTNAHAYSTAPKVGQTADSSHAPGHMQAGMPAAQANSADSEQAAARQIMQQMSLAMQRKDYETAQRLFDLELALQAARPVAMSMFQVMLRVHARRGEGPQAMALVKAMRGSELTVMPKAYSLMLQAFCNAHALQDAVLHMQCSVPPDCVDTFMVNGVLIAAVQAPEHDVIMEQCLDILDERGLAWDATTWRLVFRLQAKSHNVEDVMQAKAHLDNSPFAQDPEVHTAYIRALCACGSLDAAITALHHLLQSIAPPPDSSQAARTDHGCPQLLQSTLPPQQQHRPPDPGMKASEAIPAIPSVGETATAAGGSNESTQEAVSSNLSHGALQAARGPQSSTGDQSASPDRLHWRSWVDAELDNLPASAQAAEVSDNAASQSSPHQLVNTQRHSTQPHGNAALLDSDPMAQELGHDVRDRPDDAQVGHQQCQSPSLAEEGERLAESSTLAQQVVKLIQEACHTVMVAAERQEQHSLVLSVLESMKQAGIASDTAIQNSVMRVAKQQGQTPAQLEGYLVHLHQLGLKPDEQTFNVLLRAYGAHQDLQGASNLLERMDKAGILPGCYTFNAMLEAHAASGNVQGTMDVFAEMKQHGVKPDHCTFIALFAGVKNHIKAARHAADADKAQPDWKHRQGLDRTAMSEQLDEWVADMRAAGLKHCEPSLTALIQAHGHLTEFTHMMHLLRAASSGSHAAKPSLRTYNAAISALCRVGHLSRALRLEHEMVAAGINPDVYTFTSLISACGLRQQAQTAQQLWDHMLQSGVEPNLYTYNAKVKTECMVQDFDAAFDTVANMMAGQPQPDRITWQTILAAAYRFGRSDVVQQVAEYAPSHMLRSASEPQRPASLTPGNAASLSSTSADAGETASFLRSAQPELLSTDEMEDGGWSSGFDDSDDDMIGGTF